MAFSDRIASQPPTVIGGTPRGARPRPAASRARVALLADSPAMLRRTAARLREHTTDIDVVVAASTWLELVHSPAFPSDLVVLDVQRREPVSITARIRTCRAAGAQVIVLTCETDAAVREQAMGAGAAAWVSGDAPEDELWAAIGRVLGLGREGAIARAWRPAAAGAVRRPRLSLGEESALRMYASGRSVKEVAAGLSVQYETAKTYLRRVREKYARVDRPAGRRDELVARATEDGYLD